MTALKPLGSAQREISLRHSLFEEAIALVRNSAVGVLVTAIQVIAGSAWRWCTSERKRRMKIRAKNIVITGVTSGIGLELVRQLQPDNQLSAIARPSRRLDEFRKRFPNVSVYEADLADSSAVEKVADRITREHNRIDILINNAAIQHTPHFLGDDFLQNSIRREIEVNFATPCTLIYLCLPSLLHEGPAIILNINSGLALVPKASSAVYCGTKGGLNIFSQSLRHQLANTNIRVRQAFVPLVETAMTQGRGSGKISADEAAAKIIKGLAGKRPDFDIGRVKPLRLMARIFPSMAANIMKRA